MGFSAIISDSIVLPCCLLVYKSEGGRHVLLFFLSPYIYAMHLGQLLLLLLRLVHCPCSCIVDPLVASSIYTHFAGRWVHHLQPIWYMHAGLQLTANKSLV